MSGHQPSARKTPRRIVTGHDAGKSVFRLNGPPSRQLTLETAGGIRFFELWATETVPSLPVPDQDAALSTVSLTPGPGGTRFRLVELPPLGEGELNPDAFLAEMREKAPGDWNLEADNPGMHVTDTIDYGVVVSGRVTLELDEGATVQLAPGDCVVQNGTRHAWRNFGPEPCWIAFVMIGAHQKSPA